MNVRYLSQNYSVFCKHKLMGGNFAHHRRGTVDHYLSGEKITAKSDGLSAMCV